MDKVLIAEDDPVARLLLVHTIEGLGYVALKASTGKRAWDFLLDNPDVSLLIADVMMPDLDGRQLLRGIRSDSRFASLPVILTSAYTEDVALLGMERPAGVLFLPKGAPESELRTAVARLIGERSRSGLRGPPPPTAN